jgi:hypothetical protein
MHIVAGILFLIHRCIHQPILFRRVHYFRCTPCAGADVRSRKTVNISYSFICYLGLQIKMTALVCDTAAADLGGDNNTRDVFPVLRNEH